MDCCQFTKSDYRFARPQPLNSMISIPYNSAKLGHGLKGPVPISSLIFVALCTCMCIVWTWITMSGVSQLTDFQCTFIYKVAMYSKDMPNLLNKTVAPKHPTTHPATNQPTTRRRNEARNLRPSAGDGMRPTLLETTSFAMSVPHHSEPPTAHE